MTVPPMVWMGGGVIVTNIINMIMIMIIIIIIIIIITNSSSSPPHTTNGRGTPVAPHTCSTCGTMTWSGTICNKSRVLYLWAREDERKLGSRSFKLKWFDSERGMQMTALNYPNMLHMLHEIKGSDECLDAWGDEPAAPLIFAYATRLG